VLDSETEGQGYTGKNDVSEEEANRDDDTEFDNDKATRQYKCSKEVPGS
jgi:hypothetical protein